MDELLTNRTRLRSKATKLCNELKSYRAADLKSLDQDQLALKIHRVERVLHELQGVQSRLDKIGQTGETNHVQVMEDEIFLGSRLLARLERVDESQAESKSATANVDLKSLGTGRENSGFPRRYNEMVRILGAVSRICP